MAEETEEQPESGKGGGSKKLLVWGGIVAVVVLVSAIGGYLSYSMVLAPMLSDTPAEPAKEQGPGIPIDPVTITFDASFVNVMRDGDYPAATLMFQVTLECATEETVKIIEAYRPRFIDLINKLHDSKTRDELDDTLAFKESVQRIALQRCNALLKEIQGTDETENLVTDVFHAQLAVQDGM